MFSYGSILQFLYMGIINTVLCDFVHFSHCGIFFHFHIVVFCP